jgi:diamine N-acetyltransferase
MEITNKVVDSFDIHLILEFMESFYNLEQCHFEPDIAGKALLKLVNDPSLGYAWLIYYKGKAVGYIVLTFGFSLEYNGRDAFLDEIFITEEYRNRGIGKKAMEFIDEMCLKYGVNAILLKVKKKNVPARKLYKKFNFQESNRCLMGKIF